MLAMKNRMELAMGIAIGSSLQIALLVAPLLVIASHFIGPRPMDLMFTPAEVLAIFLSVLITGQIASDGESNWIEGVQLLAVYLIMAIVFYFLPESAAEPVRRHRDLMIEIGSRYAGSIARYKNTMAHTHQPNIMNRPSPSLILLVKVHQTPSAKATTDRITTKELHRDTTRFSIGITSSF